MSTSIPSNEAKTHFAQLLDRVEKGEELIITRHGRPLARLGRVGGGHDVSAAQRAVDRLIAARERMAGAGVAPFTLAEVLALRDAGRRL